MRLEGKEHFPFVRSHIRGRRVMEGSSWREMVFSHRSSAPILSMTIHRCVAVQVIYFSDKALNEVVLSLSEKVI